MTTTLIYPLSTAEIDKQLNLDLLNIFKVNTSDNYDLSLKIYKQYYAYMINQIELANEYNYKLKGRLNIANSANYQQGKEYRLSLAFDVIGSDIDSEYRYRQKKMILEFGRSYRLIKTKMENDLFIHQFKERTNTYPRILKSLSINCICNISADCLMRVKKTGGFRPISEHTIRSHFSDSIRTSKVKKSFDNNKVYQNFAAQFIAKHRCSQELLELAIIEFKYQTIKKLCSDINKYYEQSA